MINELNKLPLKLVCVAVAQPGFEVGGCIRQQIGRIFFFNQSDQEKPVSIQYKASLAWGVRMPPRTPPGYATANPANGGVPTSWAGPSRRPCYKQITARIKEFPSQGRNKILNPNRHFSLALRPFHPNYSRFAIARVKWPFYNTET